MFLLRQRSLLNRNKISFRKQEEALISQRKFLLKPGIHLKQVLIYPNIRILITPAHVV